MTLYSEFDPHAAAWLRELIEAGELPPGTVDERDIRNVASTDLRGMRDVHLFAGIGGWPYALRLAGWPEGRPVWTGSCPCQPFSAAGKRKGAADERHLWPEMFRLIRECRPPVVFGEQVASGDGLSWYAGVHADLESEGYAVGCADLCAAGIVQKNHPEIMRARAWAYEMAERADDDTAELFRDYAAWLGGIGIGPPHIRQRLFWVAVAERDTRRSGRVGEQSGGGTSAEVAGASIQSGRRRSTGGVAYARCETGQAEQQQQQSQRGSGFGQSGPWNNFELVQCGDGKTRRIERQSQPMADGLYAQLDALRSAGLSEAEIAAATTASPLVVGQAWRITLLRGYGNAIVSALAAEFIRASLEAEGEMTP